MRVGNKNDEEGKKDRGAASRRGEKMEKRVFGGADWNKESERKQSLGPLFKRHRCSVTVGSNH
jgi:hypothetical protein